MAAGPKNAYAEKVVAAVDRGREQGYQPKPVPLGPCECPGRPHDEGDEAIVKDRFRWGEASRVIAAAQRGEMGDGEIELCLQGLLSWNLTTRDVDGADQPLPIMRMTLERLSPAQGHAIKMALDEPHYLFGQTLPNGPGEPSADGLAADTSP